MSRVNIGLKSVVKELNKLHHLFSITASSPTFLSGLTLKRGSLAAHYLWPRVHLGRAGNFRFTTDRVSIPACGEQMVRFCFKSNLSLYGALTSRGPGGRIERTSNARGDFLRRRACFQRHTLSLCVWTESWRERDSGEECTSSPHLHTHTLRDKADIALNC